MDKEGSKSIEALVVRRAELFEQLKLLSDMVDGNLVKLFRRCGNPNCKCAREGQKHWPDWALLYKDNEHTKMIYIPVKGLSDSLKECQRRLDMYIQFKKVYQEILLTNRQILKLQLISKKGGHDK